MNAAAACIALVARAMEQLYSDATKINSAMWARIQPAGLVTVWILRSPDEPTEYPIIHYSPDADPAAEPLVFALPAGACSALLVGSFTTHDSTDASLNVILTQNIRKLYVQGLTSMYSSYAGGRQMSSFSSFHYSSPIITERLEIRQPLSLSTIDLLGYRIRLNQANQPSAQSFRILYVSFQCLTRNLR